LNQATRAAGLLVPCNFTQKNATAYALKRQGQSPIREDELI
jgi:hypothetical protein